MPYLIVNKSPESSITKFIRCNIRVSQIKLIFILVTHCK